MQLIIVRHAEAANTAPDEHRALTDKGEADAVKLGAALASLNLRPDVVLTSPLVRAAETARIAGGGKFTICPELEPGASPPRYLEAIRRAAGADRIMLVGHQPDAGRFISFLVSGGSMELHFALKPGSAALVDLRESSAGSLVLLMTPEVYSRI